MRLRSSSSPSVRFHTASSRRQVDRRTRCLVPPTMSGYVVRRRRRRDRRDGPAAPCRRSPVRNCSGRAAHGAAAAGSSAPGAMASSRRATGSACRASSCLGPSSSCFSTASARRVVRSRSAKRTPAPLWMIALWNSPLAAGIASRALTFPPPPDWPKMVTLPGSPPKRAACSRTHSSAATRSRTPDVSGLRRTARRRWPRDRGGRRY